MEFLDKKQDVYSFELTPRGINAMSKGALKPAYYAFLDDDILYDPSYAGSPPELQKDVEPRILQNTSYHKAAKTTQSPLSDAQSIQGVGSLEHDQNYGVTPTIGHMTPGADPTNVPRWNIRMVRGDIDTVNSELIPNGISQLELQDTVLYWDFKGRFDYQKTAPELRYLFRDGTKMVVANDYILLDIQEGGEEYLSENFELELFEIVSTGSTELTVPIFFQDKPTNIQNNILLDDNELQVYDTDTMAKDDKLAEFYFDFRTDLEISDKLICKYDSENNADDHENIYLQDNGIINIGTQGRNCTTTNETFVGGQYVIRREGDLGEPCL